ncbi:hypothetical protein EYC80_010543 [Monilinia laxa]|uniref:N-acetyltransferase domain-containing protein n=1 Tax=Monilinia laxa TaxID=61186 RepID=A0A5N6JP29_MONLA|nr:hypothetical protein EYC80_010543 [Monilinia laxa]
MMASHPSTTISHPIPISIPKSKPKPNLRLLPCDPLVDGPALLAQQIAAFSNPHEPFFFVLFPETEEREKAVKRFVSIWLSDKNAKYVKIVNEEGTLISAAKWLVNTRPLSEEQKKERITVDWHPDEDSNEWAEYLINWIHQHQISRTEGNPCVILDTLSTHPSYQRLGAGTLFNAIRHGFMATPNRYIEVEVPEKWKARPKIEYFFYERQRGDGRV